MIHQQNKPFENRNKCNTHDNARDKIGWADKSSKMLNSLGYLSLTLSLLARNVICSADQYSILVNFV